MRSTPMYLDEVVEEIVRAARVVAATRDVGVEAHVVPSASFIGDEVDPADDRQPGGQRRPAFTGAVNRASSSTPRIPALPSRSGSGFGHRPGDREQIFERFFRADAAPSARGRERDWAWPGPLDRPLPWRRCRRRALVTVGVDVRHLAAAARLMVIWGQVTFFTMMIASVADTAQFLWRCQRGSDPQQTLGPENGEKGDLTPSHHLRPQCVYLGFMRGCLSWWLEEDMGTTRQWIPIGGLLVVLFGAVYAAAEMNEQTQAPAGDYTNAVTAQVKDAQGQVVLQGQFGAPVDEDGGLERRATLQAAVAGSNADGEAEVEHAKTGATMHEIEFNVRRLQPGISVAFVIDGNDIATATTDREGRAEVELELPMPGNGAQPRP